MRSTSVGKPPPAPALKGPSIGYVVGTFPSLTETFVMREIEGLRGRGFDVWVFAIKRSPHRDVARSLCSETTLSSCSYARPDNLLRHGFANLRALVSHPIRYVRTLACFAREGLRTGPKHWGRLLYHFFAGIGFTYAVKRRGISHLHCHFAAASDMALAMNLYGNVPFSFSAHASGDIYVEPRLLGRKVQRARFVIAVCEYNRRYVDAVTGYRYADKIHRVYNGIDVAEPEAVLDQESVTSTSEESEESGTLHILSVGSLVARKGHGTLIEACAVLRGRGHSLRCEIVGEGSDRPTLERLIERHELDGSVQLLGARSLGEVYRLLWQADVFALLSEIGLSGHRDGFPTVILEAMAAGVPVVSTWISGTPEMVLDGVTGILVPERNVEAAADAIERLMRDREGRRRMGRLGRQRVEEEFALKRSLAQLARLFADCNLSISGRRSDSARVA